jgi:hypothetical protein
MASQPAFNMATLNSDDFAPDDTDSESEPESDNESEPGDELHEFDVPDFTVDELPAWKPGVASMLESVLPALQPGDDRTDWTRDNNANPLQINETLHDAKPRGWTSFRDRLGCVDIVRSLRIHTRKLVS